LLSGPGGGGAPGEDALDPPACPSAAIDLSICALTEGAVSLPCASLRHGSPAGLPSLPSAAAAATFTDALPSPSASQSGFTAASSPEAPSPSAACVRTR